MSRLDVRRSGVYNGVMATTEAPQTEAPQVRVSYECDDDAVLVGVVTADGTYQAAVLLNADECRKLIAALEAHVVYVGL